MKREGRKGGEFPSAVNSDPMGAMVAVGTANP